MDSHNRIELKKIRIFFARCEHLVKTKSVGYNVVVTSVW